MKVLKGKLGLAAITILTTLAVGCSDQKFSNSTQALLSKVESGKTLEYTRPQCEVPQSNYDLMTNVISFEMTSKGGVSFGFDLIKGIFKAFGISLDVESGQMAMQMDMADTLSPNTPLANVVGGAKMKKFSFDASINMYQAALSIDYYYKTPLSELTQNTLRNTLQALNAQLATTQSAWSTVVVAKASNLDMIVPVGALAGLKVGDVFKIYNVQNIWSGAPCESQFIMSRKSTTEAVAVGQVVQLMSGAADLKIISGNGAMVDQGARVEIQSLQNADNGSQRTSLLRSVHIAGVTSGKLDVDGKTEIDVVSYLKAEIQAIVREFGFYIKN